MIVISNHFRHTLIYRPSSINDWDCNTSVWWWPLCARWSGKEGAPCCCLSFPAWPPGRSEEEDTGGGLEQCHRPHSDRTQTFCRGRQEPDSARLNNAGQMSPSLSLICHSPLITISEICFAGGEKANIERANRTNKNRVYLATCGPAGWETVAGRHEVLRDSARWTK